MRSAGSVLTGHPVVLIISSIATVKNPVGTQTNGGHMTVSLSDDPEVLCQKCGRCCYAKEQRADGYYISKTPCPFLDTSSKLCRVYPIRSQVPWCRNPLEVIDHDPCLPSDCPLAIRFGPPGYVGCKEDK